ncbi:MAG: FAD-dependent monooxygenase [Nevskiaceae bacterium]|jgi:phenol 2-monooxygenase|nr:FAD-dependent monooxygenase [Nevskiaceae bacterium]
MQFHTNGYLPGDPHHEPPDPRVAARLQARGPGLPDTVDVLIVGTGPAGLTVAAQLARFAGIDTRVVERRSGPLMHGQADGVAVRSVEMFDTFGFSHLILREAYWVNETTFWRPDPANRNHIVRTGRIQDTADGLSEFPHLIVNQARIHSYFLDTMRHAPSRLEVDYDWQCVGVAVDDNANNTHPVTVTLRRASGEQREVRARYVVGADGARSAVREAIGRQLRGDVAHHAWGVLDLLPLTDFPDIRFKTAIQSGSGRAILIIPREGGHLVRLYVDLGKVPTDDDGRVRQTPLEDVLTVIDEVFRPYTLRAAEVAWFSIYEVAQRLVDGFDDVPDDQRPARTPRVLLAGDACHTHSAKAGQGMNVGMQDGFNLGWKLAAVLEGRASPALLHTYSGERQPVAQILIDFDREWSAMMAAGPRDPAHPERGGVDPDELQRYFERSLRFTAGLGTRYPEGPLIGGSEHQSLATGFPIGERFHSAPVVRVADAKAMELGHVHKADGAWRLYAFADRTETAFNELMTFLASPESPIARFTPPGCDADTVIDLRGIYGRRFREVQVSQLPPALLPKAGRFDLTDYEKAFALGRAGEPDIYELRGIDRQRGALVLVRPDQYVAAVLPLSAHAELTAFLGRFLLPQSSRG